MKRKFTPIFALLILVLVALACGGSDDAATATPVPSQATDQPAAPAPTSPPAESEEKPKESPTGYDTVFPLPDDVQNFTGGGGEEGINFQTSLSMDEVIEFYRAAFAKEGLTEYPILTSIEDEGFSMVFTGWPSGEELVIQGQLRVRQPRLGGQPGHRRAGHHHQRMRRLAHSLGLPRIGHSRMAGTVL